MEVLLNKYDPLFIFAAVLVLLLVWQLSGLRKRRLRRKRARLRAAARNAPSMRERHRLMMEWHELGGLKEYRKGSEKRDAREEGRKARTQGRPLSANPYGLGLLGRSRQWRSGWKNVDRNVRWIESQR